MIAGGVVAVVGAVAAGVVVTAGGVVIAGTVVAGAGVVVTGGVVAAGAVVTAGAVVVVAAVVVPVAADVGRPEPPSPCVRSSATRIPTTTARTPAAISAVSGPRRRPNVVPHAGQNSASVATGAAQTGHGRTVTRAPPVGGTGVAIAREATGGRAAASRSVPRAAAVPVLTGGMAAPLLSGG